MHARYFIFLGAALGLANWAPAQSRVGADSLTRLRRLERDLTYGTAMGFGYAAIDQANTAPSEWGTGWPGYGRRVSSNIGEFWIQEITTEGLAWAMNRPLDYQPCKCRGFGPRFNHALGGAVLDQKPKGGQALAIPRIIGAYGGAYAQSTWRPNSKKRSSLVLTNGTTSLAVGVLINMYNEFHR